MVQMHHLTMHPVCPQCVMLNVTLLVDVSNTTTLWRAGRTFSCRRRRRECASHWAIAGPLSRVRRATATHSSSLLSILLTLTLSSIFYVIL